MTLLSVVVPAHDEEALIQHAVRSISDEAIDLIVVANGCGDATAERARDAGVPLRVIDVPEASKTRALNAGNAAARAAVVAFVDADVTVSGADLVALAQRLESTPHAEVAAPTMHVAPSTSWWVRQHYMVWALTTYRTTGHVGSGVYMLSGEGRDRVGEFPDIIADDLYVQQRFAPDERLVATDLMFSVRAPATIAALVKRNARIVAGNQQLAEQYPELAPTPASAGARMLLRQLWRRPQHWLGLAVYTYVRTASHRGARRLRRRELGIEWNRDDTTRGSA